MAARAERNPERPVLGLLDKVFALKSVERIILRSSLDSVFDYRV